MTSAATPAPHPGLMTFDPTHLPLVTLGRVRPTGVFTLAEAAASGVHRHDLGQWATRGVITRVAPGAFVGGGRRPPRSDDWCSERRRRPCACWRPPC